MTSREYRRSTRPLGKSDRAQFHKKLRENTNVKACQRDEVAPRVLLRLCCVMGSSRYAPEHNTREYVHSSIAGPQANPDTVRRAAADLYEAIDGAALRDDGSPAPIVLRGLDWGETAIQVLKKEDPYPVTTGFPSLTFAQLKRVYFVTRALTNADQAKENGNFAHVSAVVVHLGTKGRRRMAA